jgi:GT2 family glycosyltransferase
MIATELMPSPAKLLLPERPKLTVQSVLFHTEPAAIYRSIRSIAQASDIAIAAGVISAIDLCYGDCTPEPIVTAEKLIAYAEKEAAHVNIIYRPFRKNLGSARGHNQLLPESDGEAVLIENPDVLPAPDTFIELMAPYKRPGVGMVEARQLPIEHPKDYSSTGETGWATAACALIPRTLLNALQGFDAESFFLYCDDVDFSWRVRLAGFKVIFQPSAVIFHHKTLTPQGRWRPTSAEQYFSAEAALLLAHKWSRPERVNHLLSTFIASGDANLRKAADEFRSRQSAGRLPMPIDPDHQVGEFTKNGFYAQHRFAL